MQKLHNLIYQTTNIINAMIYIGVHATNDLNDDYLGSGLRLNRAIKKYGSENFKREILYEFDTIELCYWYESFLVDEDFLKRKDVYNICSGGKGGIHTEESITKNRIAHLGKKHSKETLEKQRLSHIGKKPTEETRKKLSIWQQGLTKKPHSEESKNKISNKLKGRIPWNKKVK